MKKLLALLLLLGMIGSVSAQTEQLHYAMNDTDNSFTDYSGNGNTGTAGGDLPRATSMVFGDGQSLDGTDDRVEFPVLGIFDGGQAYSFSLWFQPSSTGDAYIWTADNEYNVHLRYDQNGNQKIKWQSYDGSSEDNTFTNTDIQPGDLVHVAGVYDGNGNTEIFINGTSDVNGTIHSSVATIDQPYNSFGSRDCCSDLNGNLDETRFYTGELDKNQVNNLKQYNNLSGIQSNFAPSLDNFDPLDGAGNVNDTDDSQGIDVDISADYSDPESDSGTVYIYNSSNPSDVFEKATAVSSGSTVSTHLENLDEGTEYSYEVNASDGSNSITSSTKSFTTSSSSSSNCIECFEDGSLSEYTGDTSLFSINSNNVFEGSNSLKATRSGSSGYIETFNPPGGNVSAGNVYKFNTYLDNSDANSEIYFGVDGTEDGNRQNSYFVNFKKSDSNDKFEFLKVDGGSFTTITSKQTTFPKNEWLEVVIDWRTNGSIYVDLYDSNDNFVESLQVTDSTFSQGGVGWRIATNDGTTYFDGFRENGTDTSSEDQDLQFNSFNPSNLSTENLSEVDISATFNEKANITLSINGSEVKSVDNSDSILYTEAFDDDTTHSVTIEATDYDNASDSVSKNIDFDVDWSYSDKFNGSITNGGDIRPIGIDQGGVETIVDEAETGLFANHDNWAKPYLLEDPNRHNQYIGSVLGGDPGFDVILFNTSDPHDWDADNQNYLFQDGDSTECGTASNLHRSQSWYSESDGKWYMALTGHFNQDTDRGIYILENSGDFKNPSDWSFVSCNPAIDQLPDGTTNVGDLEILFSDSPVSEGQQFWMMAQSNTVTTDATRYMFYDQDNNLSTVDDWKSANGGSPVIDITPDGDYSAYPGNMIQADNDLFYSFTTAVDETQTPSIAWGSIWESGSLNNSMSNPNPDYKWFPNGHVSDDQSWSHEFYTNCDLYEDSCMVYYVGVNNPDGSDDQSDRRIMVGEVYENVLTTNREDRFSSNYRDWEYTSTSIQKSSGSYTASFKGNNVELYLKEASTESGLSSASYSQVSNDSNVDVSGWYRYKVNKSNPSNKGDFQSFSLSSSAPSITIHSPSEGETIASSDLALNVTSSESVSTWEYSLDGGTNTTFTPNTTLTGLSDGGHTLDVYATDGSGNTGSNSVSFTVSTSSGYVEINDSVQINQSDNNVFISGNNSFHVDYLDVYGGTTDFGGSNFTVNGSLSDRIDVELEFYNKSKGVGEYPFNFSVDTVDGNNVSFEFNGLTNSNLYRVYKNGNRFNQDTVSTGTLKFYHDTWTSGVYTPFDVLRTDSYFPEFTSSTIRRDFTNSISRLEFGLDEFGENDIDGFKGTGTQQTFTNSSLKLDVTLPVDSKYNVSDSTGLTSPSKTVDLSESDTGLVEDSGYSHNLDSQKRKQTVSLTNNGSESIDYILNLSTGEDFTGSISIDQKVEKTGSETKDFINNNTFGFSVDTDEVTLGFNYTGHFPLEVDNTASNSWSGVDTTGAISSPNRCGTTNNTAISIAGSTKKNFSVEQNCNPGSKGNPTQTVTNASNSADERIWYNSTDMEVYTNKTSDTNFAIRADKSNLKNPDKRDADSLKTIVEGVSSENNNNLNVSDTGGYFRITVGDIQSSTLYTTDSDWSVTYTLSGDNTTIIDGGGGGGSTGPSTDDQTVYFGQAQTTEGLETVGIQFGTETVKNFTITNTAQEDLTATLSVGSDDVCQYIEVRPTLNSDQWSSSGSYSVDGASLNNLGTVQEETVDTQIRFNLPNRTELEEVGITDYSCEFETGSSYGVAEPLTMQLEEGFSLVRWLEDLDLIREYCFQKASLTGKFTGEQVENGGEVCIPILTPLSGAAVGGLLLFGFVGVRREWF